VKISPFAPVTKEGQRDSVLPWLTILFLGSAALGAWFLIGPTLGSGPYYKVGWSRTAYAYSDQIVLLFIAWGLALFAWRRGARASVGLLLGGALVLHVLVLFAPLPQSQDFYQYLFYGKIQAAHGANPFVANPSTFWADPWFPWIRWDAQPSVYGPAWILLAFGAAKVAGSHLVVAFVTLKLVVLALDVAVMAAIIGIAKDRPDPQRAAGWGLLAFAWNPLVLISVPLAGSADVAVVAGFALAFLAHRRGRPWLATILLTFAALVKVYAVIGIVLYVALMARQRGGRRAAGHATLATGLAVAAYAPYWAGFSTFRGLGAAAGIVNTSLTATVQRVVFAFIFHVAGFRWWYTGAEILVRVVAGIVLLWAVVWAVRRCTDEERMWYGALVVLTAYTVLTPWFLYWYLLTPLALAAVLPRNRLTYPLLTFSGTSLVMMFLPWPPAFWILESLLRYGPPFAVYLMQQWPHPVSVIGHSAPSVIRIPVAKQVAVPQTAPAAK
jgi:glycosyl transferase family 87